MQADVKADMQFAPPSDFLRIEFSGCCESLDLLENDEELENIVTWILMMNRLDAVLGNGAIESQADVASLKVDIVCSESDVDEKNARNAVADLLGLFDPVEHRVVRILNSDAEQADIATLALWPANEGVRFLHSHAPSSGR